MSERVTQIVVLNTKNCVIFRDVFDLENDWYLRRYKNVTESSWKRLNYIIRKYLFIPDIHYFGIETSYIDPIFLKSQEPKSSIK